MVGALAVVAVTALATFGAHAAGFVGQIRLQQHTVAHASVPARWAERSGSAASRSAFGRSHRVVFALSVVLALRPRCGHAHPGGWIAPAGWATLALLVTTAWLLPWYVVWLLPLAALGGDRRLELATLVLLRLCRRGARHLSARLGR